MPHQMRGLYKTFRTLLYRVPRRLICWNSSPPAPTSTADPKQQLVEVYRLATPKSDTSELDEAIKLSLKKVWPKVVRYAGRKNISGTLWAQIRCGFHRSGSPGSASSIPHATIRIFDENGRHVGGIHAPKDCGVPASFKGGIKKISYHGEVKDDEKYAFSTCATD